MTTVPRVPATANTPEIPEYQHPKPVLEWSEEEKAQHELAKKAKRLIIMAIPNDIFQSLDSCETSKDLCQENRISKLSTSVGGPLALVGCASEGKDKGKKDKATDEAQKKKKKKVFVAESESEEDSEEEIDMSALAKTLALMTRQFNRGLKKKPEYKGREERDDRSRGYGEAKRKEWSEEPRQEERNGQKSDGRAGDKFPKQTEGCFKCGKPGHYAAECRSSANTGKPTRDAAFFKKKAEYYTQKSLMAEQENLVTDESSDEENNALFCGMAEVHSSDNESEMTSEQISSGRKLQDEDSGGSSRTNDLHHLFDEMFNDDEPSEGDCRASEAEPSEDQTEAMQEELLQFERNESEFEMSMMGELTFFLGLQVKQTTEGIFINQSKYVSDILEKYKLSYSSPMKTPMSTGSKLHADLEGKTVECKLYRGMIGSLLYLTASRPDIMFATCLCARFQANPKESHLYAVKRIFRYLKGTKNLGLWYPENSGFDLMAYTDSDYGGCKLDRKSTSGSCQFLGGKLVSWTSKKQNCVSTSTAEAEYVAAASCCSQVLWMRTQLRDYGFDIEKIPILCDSKSAIAISTNPVQHSKTKHIDIRYHFLKHHVEEGTIEMYFVPTDYQLADLFTKALDEKRFTFLIGKSGMLNMG
ncbi:hypothetical protein L6452_42031 [Arctium lappa]|uniref:Uncharacterized protein n=1 Tax=Arctium lappa TaxID=4217 RepID=A0ACB8XIW6_ARCLA|nr:hypothetical protein L6452_42031 [Arctium lappa]